MTTPRSVAIVGGGVIGLCCAYYLMQDGWQVTVVERGNRDHDACSLGNAGMIVPSHFVPLAAPGMVSYGLKAMLSPESPFYIRPRLNADLIRWGLLFCKTANAAHVDAAAPVLAAMNLASRASYENLAQTLKDGNFFGLTRRGLLMLCKDKTVLEHEATLIPRAKQLGMDAQLLNPEETAKADPAIQMDVAGSVYFPLDCHLNPSRFVQSLTAELERGGAKILWNSPVTGFSTDDGKIQCIHTTQEDVEAQEIVIAAGSWSAETVSALGLRMPMQAGKGYSITVDAPAQLPELCSILTEARVAVTPMGSTLRFAGTMEVTGLDLSINQRRVYGILKSIPQYFPAFQAQDFSSEPVWSGLRPCSPDGLPYIGRSARFSNLSIAAGHAMMGLSLAPITGRLISQVLANQKPEIDLSLLHPDRYA